MLSGEMHIQCFFFKAGVVADKAGSVGAVFAQEDTIVDFVTFPFHPVEEPFQTNEFSFPMKKNFLLSRAEFFKGFLDWDLVFPASLPQGVVKFLVGWCVPRSEGLLFEGLLRIRNHLFPVDPNDPSKTLTMGASADGAIEGKEERLGFRIDPAAAIAGETAAKIHLLAFF
jgi:hypothetical protein